MEDKVEHRRHGDLDEVLPVLLEPVGDGELAEALLALVEVGLLHALVHVGQLDERALVLVPHVLDLLVDKVRAGERARRRLRVRVVVAVRVEAARDHILLEDLVELVLRRDEGHSLSSSFLAIYPFAYFEQDFVCVCERDLRVDAVELDVCPPCEEDEEEAARDDHEEAGEGAVQRAEHEALDGL